MLSAAEKLQAEMGTKPNGKTEPRHTGNPDNFFARANSVDTVALLDWLGVPHVDTSRGVMATCPGCSEDGALVCENGGLRCMHDRCKHAGPPTLPGFRTPVDLVMHVKDLNEAEAAKAIFEWRGWEVPKHDARSNDEPSEGYDVDEEWIPPADDTKQEKHEPKSSQRRATTPADVIAAWRAEGPLVHEPTGLQALDDLTGGGPVYGTRWYLSGAPDAGKTALLVQIADVYLSRGITVGLLAVDEEDSDVLTRLAQRRGWSRRHCEARYPNVLEGIQEAMADAPVRFYDDEWTIEAAAADLAKVAQERGDQRIFLGIDSVQTVSCDAEALAEREMSEVQAVTARVKAIRRMAKQHRLICMATSELGRGAYRSSDPNQHTSTLASSKWSGAIEYSARVLIGLRSVAGETDLIDLELAKNKHGAQARQGDPTTGHVFVRIDRACQVLSGVDYAPPPVEDRDARRAEQSRQRAQDDGETIIGLIAAEPGIGTRELYAAAKAAAGLGRYRVDAALHALGDRITRRPGPNRTQLHHLTEGSE